MTTKKGRQCGTAIDEQQKIAFKARCAALGITMEKAHAEAINAWLGEPNEERDRQMEDFVRFQKMLSDAEKAPDSYAGMAARIFRKEYGESNASTSPKSGAKRKP